MAALAVLLFTAWGIGLGDAKLRQRREPHETRIVAGGYGSSIGEQRPSDVTDEEFEKVQAMCRGVPEKFCSEHPMPQKWHCAWNGKQCIAFSCTWNYATTKILATEGFEKALFSSFTSLVECALNFSRGCSMKSGSCLLSLLLYALCVCMCCCICTDGFKEIGLGPSCWGVTLAELPAELTSAAQEPDDVAFCCQYRGGWRELGRFNLEKPLQSLTVKCDWKEYGRGEQLSAKIRAVRSGNDREEVTSYILDLSGQKRDALGRAQLRRADKALSSDSEVVVDSRAGDTLLFEYTLGVNADRHQLHIKFFEVTPCYAQEGQQS